MDASNIVTRLTEATMALLGRQSVTGCEAALADDVERWAHAQKQLGKDDILRHGNAIIVGSPDARRPTIALVGHLDTVPGHPSDLAASVENDRISGLGASDMKGGIAVMQVLFETLDLQHLPFSLMLVLYDREEGPYADNGLQPVLERFDALKSIDLAIAMEPTDNTLQLGCMGGLHARITFRGQAAHSARPWQGENAIHKAGPLLATLLQRAPRDVDVHGLIFREAISATLAKGGQTRNVIPDSFELNLNYRFAPRGAPQVAIRMANDELVRLCHGAEVEVVDIAPPGPVPIDNPIVDHMRRLAGLSIEPKQAWTDVARLAAFGVEAVNFGPGMTAQAHQRGEWVSRAALLQSYTLLRRVLTTPLPR